MSEIDVSKCPFLEQLNQKIKDLKKQINKIGIEHERYNEVQYYLMKEQQDKLKAENDELKKSLGLANKYVNEYKQCLDEIEEICKTTICDYPMNKVEEIMKLIKQAKRGGE